MERNHSCCFTGHRNIPADYNNSVALRLQAETRRLAEKGVTCFLAGGALGLDTLAAVTVINLKNSIPGIMLKLVLPCKDQTKGWSASDIGLYQYILAAADEVVYVADEYRKGCMLERNRRLVDMSSYCICFLTKSSGGTAYTVDYARKKGLEIINIAK